MRIWNPKSDARSGIRNREEEKGEGQLEEALHIIRIHEMNMKKRKKQTQKDLATINREIRKSEWDS